MRNLSLFLYLGATLALAGWGSSAEEPVEQIIIRKPNEAPAQGAPASIAPSGDLVAAGKAVFAGCAACHNISNDGASGVGPNLYAVAGRKAASLDGFAYSAALKSSGIIWAEAELDGFLANPGTKVPGTSMAAGMIGDADKRKAVIAYLSSLSK